MDRSTRFVPGGSLTGEISIPADKSISHRSAMIAAICDFPVKISNFLKADDTNSTLGAIQACGVKVEETGPGELLVHGAGLRGLRAPADTINIGNSGTSMRLLPGIFAGQSGDFVLDGDASIRLRPMDRIVKPLKQMGIRISAREGRFAPVTIHGAGAGAGGAGGAAGAGAREGSAGGVAESEAANGGPAAGGIKAISYEMPVASAQVKSAILLAGLFANGPTTVIEPAVCRDHTEIMLAQAGARVEKDGLKTKIYPAGRLSLKSIEVASDFSSAAFFMAAATIVPGSDITLMGVGVNPTRTGLLDIMIDMGADISLSRKRQVSGEAVADIRVRSALLSGVRVGREITGRAIDELPLVALLGAFAEGDTVVSGAAELKVKESDRIAGLALGLSGLGVSMIPEADGFAVHGGTGVKGGLFKSMGDHRMAMLGAVAGLASGEGVQVTGFGCVSVSFPDFEEKLNLLRQAG